MKKAILALLVPTAVLVLVCPVLAQTQTGGKGMYHMYNPQNETTLKGTVLRVEPVPGRMGQGGNGMQMMVIKTDKGEERVLLGPQGYLAQQPYMVKTGENVEVTGSQFTGRNKQKMFMAREVKSGSNTLMLRNAQGEPAWRGMMGKPRGKMSGTGMGTGMGPGPGTGMGTGPGTGPGPGPVTPEKQ